MNDVSDASMATGAGGSGSTAAWARPSPGRALRALLRDRHSSLRATEKVARTFPCLHGSESVPRRPGQDPGYLRSQPRLPRRDVRRTRLPAVLKAGHSPVRFHQALPGLLLFRAGGWDGPAFSRMLSDREQALDFLSPPVLLSLRTVSP